MKSFVGYASAAFPFCRDQFARTATLCDIRHVVACFRSRIPQDLLHLYAEILDSSAFSAVVEESTGALAASRVGLSLLCGIGRTSIANLGKSYVNAWVKSACHVHPALKFAVSVGVTSNIGKAIFYVCTDAIDRSYCSLCSHISHENPLCCNPHSFRHHRRTRLAVR
ncbi:hypothetical protein BC938DRAFT_478492 [Jimgerdemannia flammicorona]|uniref:Uncharacterized protein n=1 Tax=Jimgerdemannia flammicorona TaxID=994334 RepID=A0A433QMS3_9FUNG|nr:hypothetical protein BC938DRAFT_478492 [Jimgerdemannia flammicorona]